MTSIHRSKLSWMARVEFLKATSNQGVNPEKTRLHMRAGASVGTGDALRINIKDCQRVIWIYVHVL